MLYDTKFTTNLVMFIQEISKMNEDDKSGHLDLLV